MDGKLRVPFAGEQATVSIPLTMQLAEGPQLVFTKANGKLYVGLSQATRDQQLLVELGGGASGGDVRYQLLNNGEQVSIFSSSALNRRPMYFSLVSAQA